MLFTFSLFWYSGDDEEEKEERTSKVLTLICLYCREDRARCTSYFVIDLLSGARAPWFQLHPQESPISCSMDISLAKRSILPEVSLLCWKYVLPLVIGTQDCQGTWILKSHELDEESTVPKTYHISTYVLFTPESWENKVWLFNMAHKLSWLIMLLQYQIVPKTSLGIRILNQGFKVSLIQAHV